MSPNLLFNVFSFAALPARRSGLTGKEVALRQCMRVGPEERVYLLAAVVPQLRLKRSLRRLSGGDDGRGKSAGILTGLLRGGFRRHKYLCGNLSADFTDLCSLQDILLVALPAIRSGLMGK